MADYKRIVSYMYDYEEGNKKSNVGFARVEARNGQCKIMVNIKAPSLNNHTLKIYIYYRDNGKMMPVQVGDVFIRSGTGDFRTVTRADNIMNSSVPLERMCGIFLYFSDDKFFATEWDDNPVIIRNFKGEEFILENPRDECKATDNGVADLQGELLEILDTEEKNWEQELEKQAVEESPVKEASVIKEDTRKEEELTRETLDAQGCPQFSYQDYPCSPAASKIFSRYTKMSPFDDGEIAECVRIEPQDIGAFPMENWVLGNNSFLMHGYYNYRHLIFARKRCENGNEYIIGVPGFFHSRERFMAKLFGFEGFKSINRNDEMNGDFGYWYTTINM